LHRLLDSVETFLWWPACKPLKVFAVGWIRVGLKIETSLKPFSVTHFSHLRPISPPSRFLFFPSLYSVVVSAVTHYSRFRPPLKHGPVVRLSLEWSYGTLILSSGVFLGLPPLYWFIAQHLAGRIVPCVFTTSSLAQVSFPVARTIF